LLSGSYPSSILGAPLELLIPADAKVDFQLQALVGTITRESTQFGSGDTFTGQTSDWSSIQSTTIPATTVSPSLTLSPTPTVPFSWLVIPTLLAVMLTIAGLSVYFKKHQQITKSQT